LSRGLGDVYKRQALGKLFTIIYVLIGVGIITGVIANFSRALAEYHKQKKHHEKSAPVNKE
ncbi:potassium channel family protein, partial [Enterococcus sp. S181_ASV_20]|nr:potassium channel family protein [Enterococcus sp. S181_ASV_20]